MNTHDIGQPPQPPVPPAAIVSMLAPAPAEEPTAQAKPRAVHVPADDYAEPPTMEDFRALARDALASGDPAKLEHVLVLMLTRMDKMQAALIPIAVVAFQFAQARMGLIARGRGEEPCGGSWFAPQPGQVRINANEQMFFDCADTAGRAFVEGHLTAMLVKAQEAMKAAAERQAHLDAGGKVQ